MQHGHYTDRGLPETSYPWRCRSWKNMPDGKQNVLVFGCSHTYGVGLKDNEHWVHFLSQHNTKKYRYWNLGQPGASADKIVRILYGTEKLLEPRVLIFCWPSWSRRERLDLDPESLTSDNELLKTENKHTDRNNFLQNVFFAEKFAEKNRCKTYHCFAEESYHKHINKLRVLETHTIKNCWPYWDKFEQRVKTKQPSYAADGIHFGVEHHQRFAELFLQKFGRNLK